MSGRAVSEDRPPAVDVGDPPGVLAFLRHELRPSPGRVGNTLRVTLFGLLTITIGEMFRLPDILLFAYTGFIVFRTDAGSTTTGSVAGAAAIVASTALIILVFMVSLSQPALRLPLMAVLTFATGFVTKAAKLGHVLQIVGMWTVFNIPSGDLLLQGALEQTYVSGNTTSNTLPNILFMSPEESLLHSVLWNAFELVMAVVLLYLYNQVFGRDPARMLRADLANRLAAAASVCDGAPGSLSKLEKLTRQGRAKSLKLQGAAKTWHPGSTRHDDAETLIIKVDRLCLLVLAWHRVVAEPPGATLADAARTCRDAARALRKNVPLDKAPGAAAPGQPDPGASPAVLPLAAELAKTLAEIRRILSDGPGEQHEKKAKTSSGGFFVDDAWTNPEYLHFATKLTLCAAFCYGVERLSNWSGIDTCLITVFVVSFDSVGETIHKAMLRIAGCLTGAAFGIGIILLLMPRMTSLADFLLALSAPLLLAGWLKSGGERTNYAGQQIAIALFVSLLSGYGPTLDMEGGRDRIAGILLGDITVYVVFTTIWPVSIASDVRKNLGQAFERLADLVASAGGGDDPAPDRGKLRQGFDTAIAGTQASLVNDPYETNRIRSDRRDPDRGRRLIDTDSVASVQALVLPVSIIAADQPSRAVRHSMSRAAGDAVLAHQKAMAEWFRGCARWVRKGSGGGTLLATLPWPPDLSDTGLDGAEAAAHLASRAAWFGVLHDDAVTMVRKVGADADRAARRPALEPVHANA